MRGRTNPTSTAKFLPMLESWHYRKQLIGLNGKYADGIAEVSSALESEEVALILALRESKDVEVARLLVMAEERGIKVRETSKNDMWRMSGSTRVKAPPILALVGRDADAGTEILSSGGLCWLLDGAIPCEHRLHH